MNADASTVSDDSTGSDVLNEVEIPNGTREITASGASTLENEHSVDEKDTGSGTGNDTASPNFATGTPPDDMNLPITTAGADVNGFCLGSQPYVTGTSEKQPSACEDNLHGLSIPTNSYPYDDNNDIAGSFQCDKPLHQEMKNDRVNPFNSEAQAAAGTGPKTPEASGKKRLPVPLNKFMPLDSFGSDEIAGSFIQHSTGIVEVALEEKEDCDGQTLAINFEDKLVLSQKYNGLDHSLNSTKPTSSNPWVEMPPESPRQGSKASQDTVEVEQSTATKKYTDPVQVPQIQESPLTAEIKKPHVLENVSLSPLVLDIPGPCEPEDLIEGIIFSANYLGTTQLVSNRNPAKNARMFQAQEAVNRIKAPDGESQPTVEVDLFISTSKIKILNADTQETMMSHTLRSISYIADIGDLLVIMAKRHPSNDEQNPDGDTGVLKEQPKRHRVICHVLSSSDSHLIAESIGQCFNVAYQQFLQSNCIEPQNLTQADFNQLLDTQEMYHDDLVHYSKQENVKEIWVEKKKGESMGIAIVESGWGSIIPTVILANLQHGSPIERNGKFSIGDQIMAINSTSMVGLPLQTCHSIIKGLRNQTLVKTNIVSCPPVVSVLIKRPNLKHQLGFSVQNGIICSLMRGGIAERGGVRVGHRIIEINDQSVVATPHDKIVQMLVTSVGEIQMKTMPAAMYRLLTGQEQPLFL